MAARRAQSQVIAAENEATHGASRGLLRSAGSLTGGPDLVASLTLALVALIALAAAWRIPWWKMEARAPQYGQRVLVVLVGPRDVTGDVLEMDRLGHYVGIQPIGSIAPIERTIAPYGLAGAFLGLLVVAWCRQWWLRLLLVLPVLLMPVLFLADLDYWMHKSVDERDPDAALNLTVTKINPKLMGHYELGQFKVDTQMDGGLYLAGLAGLLGAGLVFAIPLPWPSGRKRAASAAAGALLALWSLPSYAAELVVGEGETIAGTLAAARDGDTVIVPAGIHPEHVILDKRVRLVGKPGAVIDGENEGTVVRVTAAGAEVRGLRIRNSGDTYRTEDAGIRIDHAANVRIADTRIEDTLFGLFVVQGDGCVLERSTIIGKDLPHVRRGDGIRLWYSSGCHLLGNTVERSRDVIIWYSSDTVAEDNTIRASRYGLHYMYSDRNVFRRNRFEDNQVGATIMYSRGIELEGNTFSFSDGFSAPGLLVKDADDVFIVGNRFVGNQTGLFFDDAPQAKDGRVEVRRNWIARNAVGIALQPLTERIEFSDNAFIGNRVQVQVLGSGSAERNLWAIDGRGNYWSDAVVYDANGDGISELPVRLENTYEALADRYPELAFFDGSPSADAIDTAARLFPIFAPRPKLTDPHPLMKSPVADEDGTAREPRSSGEMVAVGGMLLATAALSAATARRVLS